MIRSCIRPLLWLTGGLALSSTVAAVVFPVSQPTTISTASTDSSPAPDSNPTVTPGLVKWHPTLPAAQAAARQSGKPVLVFHMMGQLDKQFC
jgi:hypothetical protein